MWISLLFFVKRSIIMAQGRKITAAVLALVMAVSVLLPFNALPSFADDGKVVALANSASSTASSYDLNSVINQYSDVIDRIEAGLKNHDEYIDIYNGVDNKLPAEDIFAVIDYFRYYKLCYYLDPVNIHYTWDGTYIVKYTPDYIYSADEIAAYDDQLYSVMDSVVSKAQSLPTDVEKLLYIHNFIVDTVTYDNTVVVTEVTDDEGNTVQQTSTGILEQNNAYGAMVLHCSMCEGYAESFSYMANKLGIPTYVITSSAIGHAWNLVYLDGYYYHVDCTWDDPSVSNQNYVSNPLSGYAQNKNFLCSDSEIISTGHVPSSWTSTSGTDWTVSGVSVYGIAANSDKYSSLEFKTQNTLTHYADGAWYYAYNGDTASSPSTVNFKIYKVQFLSNSSYRISTGRSINSCYKTSSGGWYSMFYSTLQDVEGSVYYSTADGIYKLVEGGAQDGSGDLRILKNNVDQNLFDFDIDTASGTFSVLYGDTITAFSATSANVVTYNNAAYFCQAEGHRYSAKVDSELTDETDGVTCYTCVMCSTSYRDVVYCKLTMINFFNAALNSCSTDTNYNFIADVNHDGFVNVRDYALIINGEYINELNWQGTVHEHSAVIDAAVPATCSSTGLTQGSHCSVCGEVLVTQTTVPMLEHTWNEGTFVASSSQSGASIVYVCTACGTTKSITATGWQLINGSYYFYDDNGYPYTGFCTIGSTTYYFNSSGVMQTGWQQVNGTWYYFDSQGAMQTGWQQIGGSWYYFNTSGAMQTGWLKVGGSWYYLESSGKMLANTSKVINGKTYYFNSSGVCTNP